MQYDKFQVEHDQAATTWKADHEERMTEVQNLYERRQTLLQEESDRLRDQMDHIKAEAAKMQPLVQLIQPWFDNIYKYDYSSSVQLS